MLRLTAPRLLRVVAAPDNSPPLVNEPQFVILDVEGEYLNDQAPRRQHDLADPDPAQAPAAPPRGSRKPHATDASTTKHALARATWRGRAVCGQDLATTSAPLASHPTLTRHPGRRVFIVAGGAAPTLRR
ncbi:hypothetical protein GCM10023222_57740 [Saccharopolyspora cebuensis]